MPFACIFVPDFPVEALLRAEPELRSQAVAVLEGKAPLQKIFAVHEKARRAGVSVGMTKLQVEACPDLVLRPRSSIQEAAAHATLLDCAQSFSPRVEDAGCDTVLLDLDGLEPLFGSLPKIARDLARRACDLGLEVNVAVASNPDTAVIAAHGFSGVIVIPTGRKPSSWAIFHWKCCLRETPILKPCKYSSAGAFEIFALWRLCLKSRWVSDWDRKAFACNSWRAAALPDRWFRWSRRLFLKRRSSWNIPWCCS